MFLAHGTDIWGVAVPAWIGAVGTVSASAVAVIALLTGRGARRGVEQLAEDSNREANTSSREPDVEAIAGTGQAPTPEPPWAVTWFVRRRANIWNITNTSPTVALVTKVEPSENVDITWRSGDLPLQVGPGEMISFEGRHKPGTGPIASVKITWTVPQGPSDTGLFYLLRP